MEMEFNCM